MKKAVPPYGASTLKEEMTTSILSLESSHSPASTSTVTDPPRPATVVFGTHAGLRRPRVDGRQIREFLATDILEIIQTLLPENNP
jgi:hypothetical protein